MPNNEGAFLSRSAADRPSVAKDKAKLFRLLEENPKVTRLTRVVEQRLGIMRMLTIRRIQPPKPGRRQRRKPKEIPNLSLISQIEGTERERTVWEAIRRVLGGGIQMRRHGGCNQTSGTG